MSTVAVIGMLCLVGAVLVVLGLLIDKGVDIAALGVERLGTIGRPRAYIVVNQPAEEVYSVLQHAGQLTQQGEIATEVGVRVQIQPGMGDRADRLECRWSGRPDTVALLQAVKASVETVDASARVIVK